MKVLIVEDEASLREGLRFALEREGFRVAEARDGREALDRFRTESPGIVLLDLMLPEVSGLDVCKAIRASSDVPIIVVTAKEEEADVVAGLEVGADDYITKPFSTRELIARVRAVARRSAARDHPAAGPLSAGPFVVDVDAHEARCEDRLLDLPPKEFALLVALLERAGRLVTRGMLIEQVWGSDYVGDTRTLDVHIKRLRQKVERDAARPRHIVTVRGLGYKLETE